MWEFEPVPPLKVSREGLIAQNAVLRHALRVNAVLWRRDVSYLRRAAGLIEEQSKRLEAMDASHYRVMEWVAALQAELLVWEQLCSKLTDERDRLCDLLDEHGLDIDG